MNLRPASTRADERLTRTAATLVCFLLAVGHASAQSSFHSAAITRVAVDPANSILATASEDKTVRIWQLSTGRLLRTINAPARTGEHGKVYALALSRDGKSVAFAGYTGQKNERAVEHGKIFDYEIYIHEVSTGRRLHTLSVPGIVDNLAWSQSGEFLLATISNIAALTREDIAIPPETLHIFKAPEYARVAFPSVGYVAAVAGHDGQGRLIVAGKPGGSFTLEIFDKDFKELESRELLTNPAAMSISPDGSAVAIASLYSKLSVHSTTDLSALYEHDFDSETAGGAPGVPVPQNSTVAWSADGRWLYYAGRETCNAKGCAIRKWDARDWMTYTDTRVSPHRVTHLVSLRAGGVAFGTVGPGFGILDSNDQRTMYREEPAPLTLTRSGAATPQAAQRGGEYWTQCHVPGTGPFTTGRADHVPGKYLFIDKSGAAVLSPRFDEVGRFADGLARVSLGDRGGFINHSGRLTIPLQFDGQVGDFSEGRAAVQSGDLLGYIDRTGKIVIPAMYSAAAAFSGGLARVKEYGRPYYGYINVLGETVVPLKFESADDFHEGLAAVQLNDKWGYINTQGAWVVTPTFDFAARFSEGLAAVRVTRCTSGACSSSIIDRSGAVVLRDVQLSSEASWFSDGMAVAVSASRERVFIDRTGQTVGTAFQEALPFAEGLAAASTPEGKWGHVDKKGAFAIAPQYDETSSFSEGRASVFDGNRWGYVDQTGKVVIPPLFLETDDFSEGVARVCVSKEQFSRVPVSRTRPEAVSVRSESISGVPILKPQPLRLDDAEERKIGELNASVERLFVEARYSEALTLAQESLGIVELWLARDDPAVIRPLRDIGRIHHVLGDYRALAGGRTGDTLATWREAQGFLERALLLQERRKGAYDAEVVPLAEELSDVVASLGDFDRAMDLTQRVLAVRKATGGADRPAARKAANDLELLRIEKLVSPSYGKELSKALPLALEQIRHAEALGADHVNVARGLANLAKAYGSSKVGVRTAAFELYERARTLYAAAGIENRPHALELSAAVARLLVDARRYKEAERTFDLVARNAEKVLGSKDPAIIQLGSERAFAFLESGQYEAAAGLFTRALEYGEEQLKKERRAIGDVRRALERLADTRRLMGDYSSAEALYQRILESRDRYIVMHWSIAARVLRKLGTSQRLRGDLTSARHTYEAVLELLKPHLSLARERGVSTADVITRDALQELAALAVAAKDAAAARDYLNRAAPLDHRLFWSFPGSDREMVDQDRARLMNLFYHQVLETTARYLREDSQAVARAYELVLDRKGTALDLQAYAKASADPATERTRRNLEELADVRSELAGAMVARRDAMSAAQYAETVTLLFERALALEQELSRLPPFVLIDERRRVTTAEVSARLPRDTALVEFVRVREEDPASRDSDAPTDERAIYLAFVLTPAGTLSVTDLGSARPIDVLAGDLQAAMRSNASPSLMSELLKELYGLVWAPLDTALGSSPQIIVSPDGELHRVPFAALIDERDRFLIERFRFTYTGSGRDLVRSKRTRATPVLDLALIADPDFGAGGIYAPLPGTSIEAQQVPPLVSGSKGQRILRGGEASETAVKQLPPARILHFATHGFFLPQETFGLEAAENEHVLVKSGLVLAGANRRNPSAGSDDGLLTALEVSGIDLSASDLVVLSSCDSGAGAVLEGQGVLGLRRALSLAGAQNVLMALWPVADDTTAEMMVSFYRHMTSVSPALALHQTQLEVITRLRTRDGFALPRLWAPFILESAAAFALPDAPK